MIHLASGPLYNGIESGGSIEGLRLRAGADTDHLQREITWRIPIVTC